VKLSVIALLFSLTMLSGCKDEKAAKDLADAKAALADKEDDLEASHKKLKAAESAQSAAEERAKLAEAKLKESDVKLKEAEAKLKAAGDASVVSDPNAPATPASGNATCDKYWVKLNACNEAALKGAPESTKEAMRKAFADAEKQTKEAWKNMDGAVMTTACEAMIDALKQNPSCPKQ
jgi:outer membrane murein-binding lipoprotein Lpp